MNTPSQEEKDRLFNRCFGLTAAEEATNRETWIAFDEEGACLDARIQTAPGPLASLLPQPRPEELAERPIQRRCAAAREFSETGCRKATHRRSPLWEDLWLCPSSNTPMK